MVTPMLTQLSYEGILDEFNPISCGFIKIPANIVASEKEKTPTPETNTTAVPNTPSPSASSSNQLMQYRLSNDDTLFSIIRNLSFGMVLKNLKVLFAKRKPSFCTRYAICICFSLIVVPLSVYCMASVRC